MNGCVEGAPLIWRGRKRAVPSKPMRSFYRENIGPLADDEQIHHLCGNPWCVAKAHVVALSAHDHMLTHHLAGLPFGFNETAF